MGTLITRGGIIYVDFRFKGQRCREVTQMPDTQQNRRKCDAFLKRIEAEIVLGTFDYASYFPDGGKVDIFRDLERRWHLQNRTRRSSVTLRKHGSPNGGLSGGGRTRILCASRSTNTCYQTLATQHSI